MVDEETNDGSSGSGIDVSESSGSTTNPSPGKHSRSVHFVDIKKI